MMASSNEDFLAMLEKDYPDTDWDNLPPIEPLPDEYSVVGQFWGTTYRIYQNGVLVGYSFSHPNAEIAIQQFRFVHPELLKDGEVLTAEIDHIGGNLRKPYQYHFEDSGYKTVAEAEERLEKLKTIEGYIPESMTIKTVKCDTSTDVHFYADFRKDVLEGKKVFPLNLP